jgi:hypothetical protein
MEFYKKILITAIIVITAYVIWRLLKRKQSAMEEGFTLPTIIGIPSQDAELEALKNANLSTKIQNTKSLALGMPLLELCIKGSYNSAFTGNYINADMIKYVISRGCRFLDFEVYYIPDEKGNYIAQVGYGTDKAFMILESVNSIPLDTALLNVVANGFSQVSPNNADPIFINLRIKSANPEIYHAVAASIVENLGPKLHSGKVTNQTLLSELQGQVVIIIDKTINRNYAALSTCPAGVTNCYDLKQYTNMESGSETLKQLTYTDATTFCNYKINILDDSIHTDVKNLSLAVPDVLPATKTNPKLSDFIYHYGCQDVPFRFYYNDANLALYEEFFNDNKSAFVPLAAAMNYFNQFTTT